MIITIYRISFLSSLHIDLKPWDSPIRTAEYSKFSLDNENENYKLQISQYQSLISSAGDSLSSPWDNANGAPFSTFDHDHDNLFYDNCALTYHGAWWFTSCFQSHLNGAYGFTKYGTKWFTLEYICFIPFNERNNNAYSTTTSVGNK